MQFSTDFRQRAQVSSKPNVIVFVTDDQPDGTLNYVPAIRDKLGNRGVMFTDAFVTTGLCCPSRASILTGQYAHHHGVLNNRYPNGGVRKFNDTETLPVWLQRAGYQTALVGKYMNEYDQISPYIPPGWNSWVAFDEENGKYFDYNLTINGKRERHKDKDKDYSTHVLAKKAVNFIKRTKEPFFLYFAPHAPHGVPRPAPKDEKKCKNVNFPRTPAFNEENVSDKPGWIKKLSKLNSKEIKDQKEEFQRKMCTLKAVDDAMNDILKALGNKRDNTIIIFISDNGFSFGEHRWTQKECSYTVCVGVDMIISYPKLTPTKKTSSQFALNIDIAPTILDLAGIPIPSSVDGKSLKPLLTDQNTTIHESFLIETYNNESNPKGEDYAIRTKQYLYNELFTGERELYDYEKDPYELQNVAENPEYQTIRAELATQLQALLATNPQTTPTLDLSLTPTPGDAAFIEVAN